LSKLNCK